MRLRILILALLSGPLCSGCSSDRRQRRPHRHEPVRTQRDQAASHTQLDREAEALRNRIRKARQKMASNRTR